VPKHFSVPRTLKRGCKHIMKHVETDSLQRKSFIKYTPKMHPDCCSPKDLSASKAMSQHPLTQAYLFKKSQNHTINASLSTAPTQFQHMNQHSGFGPPSQLASVRSNFLGGLKTGSVLQSDKFD